MTGVKDGVRLEVAPGRRLFAKLPEGRTAALYDAGAYGVYADGTWVAASMAAHGLPTVLYSRAGLYGSDPVPEGETPDPFFHAADMARLLDHLGGEEPVILIGHSMAGLRLRAFTQLYPERVRALIFVDAVVPAQLKWALRRELVRFGVRLAGGASPLAGNPLGRAVMGLYPNNILLSGDARRDKVASLASPYHLKGTAREMIASTAPQLAAQFTPLPAGIPKLAVTATPVAWGTGREEIETHHIPRTGHAEILRPIPAAEIARWTARLLAHSPAVSLALSGAK